MEAMMFIFMCGFAVLVLIAVNAWMDKIELEREYLQSLLDDREKKERQFFKGM